jgi:hypothetical protein
VDRILQQAIALLLEQEISWGEEQTLKAYWVLPDGHTFDVPFGYHGEAVTLNPELFGITAKDLAFDDPAKVAMQKGALELHLYNNWRGVRRADVLGLKSAIRRNVMTILQLLKRWRVLEVRIGDNISQIGVQYEQPLSIEEFSYAFV